MSEYYMAYTLGALGYCAIEIMWRGYSHWSMTVTGGICFMLVYFINESFDSKSLLEKSILSSLTVTAVEFAVGCVVNLMFGWNVWDYSDRPISLMGQICPEFFLLWLLLCIPATMLAGEIKRVIFGYR